MIIIFDRTSFKLLLANFLFHSGGIKRDWIGVPRMFFKPGQTDYRCACVNEKGVRDTRMKPYVGCGISEVSCKVQS